MAKPISISAVIPCYNNGDHIADAVASIRRQTHPVDEIIIVDDGSTDDSAEVIAALGDDIVYIHQENAGPSAARNTGVDAAQGNWIAFLDADDQWTAEKTEQQLAALERSPSLSLVASDMAEIDTKGKILVDSVLAKHDLLERFRQLDGKPMRRPLAELLEKNFIPTGTVLVDKAVLQEAGGFNPFIRYGEDLELWGKIAVLHYITCLPQVHMLRRQHGANATQASEAMLVDLVKVMDSLRNKFKVELNAQGIKPSTIVTKALNDLGYWYFDKGDFAAARNVFKQSLIEGFTRRALVYKLICHLPPAMVGGLRRLKQQMSG